jgi:phosphoribosylformylglycinamidine cyclo-ligase
VGIDLVAMCVNDIVVTGAEPLFFLDYFATSRLDPERGKQIVAGIVEGCRQAGCALLGGETAEMPGFYQGEDYDLAGFAVGVVERDQVLGSHRVNAGDVLLGLASSGLHSNGFSLVRKVLVEPGQSDLSAVPAGLDVSLGQELLRPTRIYVKAALELIRAADVHALAHITGGGLPGNLPRVLPGHLAARITRDSWTVPGIFRLVQEAAGIDEAEMLKTFNLGVGMVAAVSPDKLPAATDVASRHRILSWPIGQVVEREPDGKPFVLIPASRS